MRLFGRRDGHRSPRGEPTYRNSAVIDRLMREEGVDQATAEQWFAEMLRFLDLCAESETMLSPSKNVDKAWHAFILNTRDYEAYCRERFGRFLHHDPTGKPDPDAYERAYELARSRQGSLDPLVWPVPIVAGGVVAGELGDDEEEAEDQDGRAPYAGGSGCGAGFDGAHDTSDGGGAACSGGASCGASCGGGGCGGGG